MMKKNDWELISCLRKNGRETLTKISRKTKVPISTLYDKLRSDKMSLITKHTCLLNFSKIGFNTRAKISLKVDKECRQDIKFRILEYKVYYIIDDLKRESFLSSPEHIQLVV